MECLFRSSISLMTLLTWTRRTFSWSLLTERSTISLAYERAMAWARDFEEFTVTFAWGVTVTISPYLNVAVTPASIPTLDSIVLFTSSWRENFSETW